MTICTIASITPISLCGDRTATITLIRNGASFGGEQVKIKGSFINASHASEAAFSDITVTLPSGSTDAISTTVTISESVANAVGALIPNDTTYPITYVIDPVDPLYESTVGTGEMIFEESNSRPTYSGTDPLVMTEDNAAVYAKTGENSFLTTVSKLMVNCSAIIGQRSATIVKRYVTVDGKKLESLTASTLGPFSLTNAGTLTVVAVVTDSRGFKTAVSQTITVQKYTPPTFDSVEVVRSIDYITRLKVTFEATVTDVRNGTAHHGASEASARVKVSLPNASTGTNYNVSPLVITGYTGVSFDGLVSGLTIDENSPYDCVLSLYDGITTTRYGVTIPKARPVLSLRDGRVGINLPAPTCALDVNGVIAQNGYPVEGFRSVEDLDNQDDLTAPGFYWCLNTSGSGYVLIEVYHYVDIGSGIETTIQKKIAQLNGATHMYVRSIVPPGNWTNWATVV